MTELDLLSQRMREDWDRRVLHDYRFWMSDGHADDEAMWRSGARDFGLLTEGLQGGSQRTLLDVGCGVGRLLRTACSGYGRVIGVDVSSAAIEKAHSLLGEVRHLELHVGNGIDLCQVPDASVDVVLSFAALVSMPTRVLTNYLREIHRVLKPQGIARLQVYTGKTHVVSLTNTLDLRSYEEERLREALQAAGFALEWIKDLVLPFQTSYDELGFRARIVSLARRECTPESAEQLAARLLPQSEAVTRDPDSERDLEYWMAVNYAKELAERGELGKAKETLEFAATVSQTTSIDVRDLLDALVKRIGGPDSLQGTAPTPLEGKSAAPAITVDPKNSPFFEKNLLTLKRKFPQLEAQLRSIAASPADLKPLQSEEGPVLCLREQVLDHPTKPVTAAQAWVKRCLQDERYASAAQIVLIGCGTGYHLEQFLEQYKGQLYLVEPEPAVFWAMLCLRDVTQVLEKLQGLQLDQDSKRIFVGDDCELLVRPQAQALYPELCSAARCASYGSRGLRTLQPTMGVVGPLQGGTLPTTAYTLRALHGLRQRVREYDVSGFTQGYHYIDQFFHDKYRVTGVQNNYLEVISHVIHESIKERPVDILICMAQAPLSIRYLTELRKSGVITVLWFVEDYLRFTYWREMARCFDFVFTIQKGECLEAMRAAGAGEAHYLPCACDPGIHAPVQLSAEERQRFGSPISFVGAGYHNRQQVFAAFAELPFKIWGTEWPGCRPFDRMLQEDGRRVSPTDYVKVFNATDVNINLHSSSERDGVDPTGDFVNPRTFELAAAGAFQLVDQRSLLPDLFVPGKEVVTFSDVDDLKRKIQYYLAHPEERQRIAAAARERVLREHTYDVRIRQMLSIIYSSKHEQLQRRLGNNPWSKMLSRSADDSELHAIIQRAHEKGHEPTLDGVLIDVMKGEGKLSQAERKLLLLFHVRKQMVRMAEEERGNPRGARGG